MTCTHVLGLIDAGPLADYPRAHLDAAWQHARQCATCGPALEAATSLSADLTALPLPAPPPNLAAAVLARIAQIEPSRPVVALAETKATSGTRDWSVWATPLGGLAAALAFLLSMPPGHWVSIGIAPRLGGLTAGLVTMPSTTWAFVLGPALVLYVAGLFGPFRGGRRS